MADGDTIINALLGAVVSIVLSFLPFSPLLGGLVAGYLQGGSRGDGLRVGAIAGLIALLPLLGLVAIIGGAWGIFLLGGMPTRVGAIGVVLGVLIAGVLVAYTVGVSALGGWLGNYVRTDTDLGG